MLSACLLCEIQYIENSWLDIIIDFNKIHCCAVIENRKYLCILSGEQIRCNVLH